MIEIDAITLWEFKRMFAEHPLFLLGLLLLIGYLMGKIAMRFRLPEITGFILAGLLVSPHTTGVVSIEMNEMLHLLKEVAIGFLALTIGAEFSRSKLRRIGRDIAGITLINVAGTFVVVWLGCMALNHLFMRVDIGHPYAILLAVIACATSPAIIVAEVHHLRAHGRFVDYLFGVVALTDAIAVIAFGVAFTLVVNMLGDVGSYSLIRETFREIVTSALAGGLAAVPLAYILRFTRGRNELMIITIGYVFVVTGAALALTLSPLLTNMALGAALVQFASGRQRVFRSLEAFTPPIYALFFVLAGLQLDPRVFASLSALGVGTAYVLLRGVAKYGTTWAGCRLRHTPAPIRRHLGLCMFSKGGIALGFVLLIQTSPAMEALRVSPVVYANLNLLVNVVLLSIFVNELLSPIFLRYAVTRGSELES